MPSHAYNISKASMWSVPEWKAQSQTSKQSFNEFQDVEVAGLPLVWCGAWAVSLLDWLLRHLKIIEIGAKPSKNKRIKMWS